MMKILSLMVVGYAAGTVLGSLIVLAIISQHAAQIMGGVTLAAFAATMLVFLVIGWRLTTGEVRLFPGLFFLLMSVGGTLAIIVTSHFVPIA
jgi:hypothetical protein